MTKNYKINYTTNTITMTKKFAEAAGIIGSVEFEQMKILRGMGMSIKVQSASAEAKKKQSKWTYEQMERYIMNTENSEKYSADYMTIKNAIGYMGAWNWFRTTFPNYKETPELNANHKIIVASKGYRNEETKIKEVA